MKSIYKYCSIDTAIKIIESGAIRFSYPKRFNDTVDIDDIALHHIDFDSSKIHQNYLNDLEELKRLNPLLVDRLSQPELWERMYRDITVKKYFSLKVTCFSVNGKSNYCWFHHSDKFKGVCLVFDYETIFPNHLEYKLSSGPVNYVKKYKRLKILSMAKIKFFRYWLYTKKIKYSKEAEIRFMQIDKDNIEKFKDFQFNPNSLKGVVFGRKCSESDKLTILNLLRENDFNIPVIKII